MNDLEDIFIYFSIGLTIFLLLGMVKYFLREKYAIVIIQHPETKLKIIESRKKLISHLRLGLWSSPLDLILLPWLMDEYVSISGYIVFVCMALVQLNILVEYLYSKWLYEYLSKPEIP